MESKAILEAIKSVRKSAKKRNFKQTFDLAISLKDIDLKKTDSKIKAEIVLPNGRGKPIEVAAIAEGILAENAKKAGIKTIINKAQLAKLATNKKETKKLVNTVDFFISQPDLMVEVGKTLGPVLGPRDKMPKPVPPDIPLEGFLKRFNNVINLSVKEQPIVHCLVGTEDMDDAQIQQNIEAVLDTLKGKLPKGEGQIRAVHVKLTMSPAVKIGVKEQEAEKKE